MSAPEPAVRRYTFKLKPNATQAEALETMRRRHCDLYNACLQQRTEAYQRRGVTLTEYDQAREIKFLRRECPEFSEIGVSSLALTVRRVDRAFKAFFRRARAGAGVRSGFPHFKSGRIYPGFSFRCGKRPDGKPAWSGWRFDIGAPKLGDRYARPRDGRLYVKGVSGMIKARGRLPVTPDRIVMADALWRENQWWLSLVVEQPMRRRRGHGHATIKLNLIDSFAAVETAEIGPCGSGPEADLSSADGRITPTLQGVGSQAGAAPQETGGERRMSSSIATRPPGAAPPISESDRRVALGFGLEKAGVVIPVSESDRRPNRSPAPAQAGVALPVSEGDRRDTGRDHAKIATIQQAMARCKRWSNRYRKLSVRKARIEAKMARRRREHLHVWTTAIQRRYATVTFTSPPLTEVTKSGRGTSQRWGAMVKDKARLNRHILDFAAGAARAQLEYKFAESGGEFQAIETPDHPTAVGNLLVKAGKTARTLRRKTK